MSQFDEKQLIFSQTGRFPCWQYVQYVHTALDRTAPLRRRVISQRRLAPWFNSEQHRQNPRKLEWNSTKLEECYTTWKERFFYKMYKCSLHEAVTTHYLTLIEENKNKPRFMFSTVARLTKSHNSVVPCIPRTLSNDDFVSFAALVSILSFMYHWT